MNIRQSGPESSCNLEDLANAERLGGQLRSVLRAASRERVSVGLMVGGRFSVVGVNESERNGEVENEVGIQIGCAAKLFTAAMMCDVISHGHFGMDSKLEGVIGGNHANDILQDVTPRQLLEHTHGFDASVLGLVQRRSDGFMEIDALCQSLQSGQMLARPGRFYSYGNSGALLVAGILERVHGKPFSEILGAYLTSRGIALERRAAEGGAQGCPATGGSFAISMAGLLRFLAHQACSGDGMFGGGDRETLERKTRALPGWHATERGIYLGWKYYGSGWFGHNSEMPGSGLLVRLNPQERIGIVVASGDHPPSAIASALFRKYLPSLVRLEMPKLQRERAVGSHEAGRLHGIYANRAVSVRITADERSQVFLSIADNRDGGTILGSACLHPAQDRIFFLQPPAPEHFPFVQFVGEGSSECQYLWTGSQILRRVEGLRAWGGRPIDQGATGNRKGKLVSWAK